MEKVAIGIDIGGTFTKFGIVDKKGNVIAEASTPSDKYAAVEDFLKELAAGIKKMTEALPGDTRIIGIGMGAPNGNYYTGTIEFAPNLRWKGVLPMVELLKAQFDLPVIVLTNDANAAAIGEMIYGGAKHMQNFIMITLGTGLGSGIVVNGNVVYGHDGFAGEMGHVIVEPNGRVCGCGRRGCLETYVSAPGIIRTVFELMADTQQESGLRDIPYRDLDSKMIFEAAEKGDKIALEAFDITSEVLGKTLADSVVYTSPEAIFLFGGLANARKYIIKPTKQYMEKNLMDVFKDKVSILPSELDGAHAAILGSSALAWKESGE